MSRELVMLPKGGHEYETHNSMESMLTTAHVFGSYTDASMLSDCSLLRALQPSRAPSLHHVTRDLLFPRGLHVGFQIVGNSRGI